MNIEIVKSLKSQAISKVVNSISGRGEAGTTITDRRIAALEAAGFQVEFEGIKWNWGTSGYVSDQAEDGSVMVQLTSARGCRSKNGASFNRCEVYKVY